jgi:hypothetical protein
MHTSTAQSHARPHSHHHAGRSAAAAAPAATSAKPSLYNPRHPERTLLYQTIADHFETWHELASAGQFDGGDAQMDDGMQTEPDWDMAAQPVSDYEVDKRVSW